MATVNKKNKIKSNFSDKEGYNRRIRKFVPYYDEMMDSILACLPETKHGYEVLELGCGTGNLSARLLNEKKFCKLTAIDLVQEMAHTCRERLIKYANRLEIIQADIVEFSQSNAFDYVVSSLALHYPDSDEKKISTCRNIFKSLKPGGIFSFSVMLSSEFYEPTGLIWKCWEKDVFKNGVSREELNEWHRTYHISDYPVPLSLWLKWLKEVGFEHCEIVWKRTIFGTIWVKKKALRRRFKS